MALALLLALGTSACVVSGSDEGPSAGSGGATASDGLAGMWRGSVTYVRNTVYGSSGGVEPLLDVILEGDGTCSVVPLEDHADLPSDSGTWEDLGEVVVLYLGSGQIELEVVDGSRLEGDPSDFGVSGFDSMAFDYYG